MRDVTRSLNMFKDVELYLQFDSEEEFEPHDEKTGLMRSSSLDIFSSKVTVFFFFLFVLFFFISP